MKPIDAQVLAALSSAGPISEQALADRLSESGDHWPRETVAASIQRLRAEQLARRLDDGRLEALEPSAPIQNNSPPETDMAKQKCGKCGGTDLTPAGKCRACKKIANDAYRTKQNGAPPPRAAKPDPGTKHHVRAGARRKKAAAGVPLDLNGGDRMVIMQFAIRIEDAKGDVHDLFLTGDVVKRLAIELQEYA